MLGLLAAVPAAHGRDGALQPSSGDEATAHASGCRPRPGHLWVIGAEHKTGNNMWSDFFQATGNSWLDVHPSDDEIVSRIKHSHRRKRAASRSSSPENCSAGFGVLLRQPECLELAMTYFMSLDLIRHEILNNSINQWLSYRNVN